MYQDIKRKQIYQFGVSILLQRLAEVSAPGFVNFITAVAYHFCLNLPVAFTQPGPHLLAESCISPMHCLYKTHFGFLASISVWLEDKNEGLINILSCSSRKLGVRRHVKRSGKDATADPTSNIKHRFLSGFQTRFTSSEREASDGHVFMTSRSSLSLQSSQKGTDAMKEEKNQASNK